ncbi:MAG: hypothetical protein ACYDEP_06235 [Acidimicrobiales bacterium]
MRYDLHMGERGEPADRRSRDVRAPGWPPSAPPPRLEPPSGAWPRWGPPIGGVPPPWVPAALIPQKPPKRSPRSTAIIVVVVVSLLAAISAGVLWAAPRVGKAIDTAIAKIGAPPSLPKGPPSPPPPGAYATPSTPGVVIDLASAEKVFSTEWPMRAEALSNYDLGSLSRIERGAALLGDEASIDCKCELTTPAPLEPPHLFTAAQQSSYPATFLAEVQVDRSGYIPELTDLVFRRASRDSPWLIVFATSYTWGRYPLLSIGDSFSVPPGPPSLLAFANRLPGDLAQYWQAWKDTGKAPLVTPFVNSGYLLSHGTDIANAQSYWRARGNSETTSYYSGAGVDGSYAFTTRYGAILLCTTVRWTSTIRATSKSTSVNQPFTRDEVTPQVPPGNYRWVRQLGIRESCFLVAPNTVPSVLGERGGTYSGTTSKS